MQDGGRQGARLWMKREIAKSRAWIETEARQRRDFFLGFMFEPRNRRELSNFAQSRSRSRRENFSSVRDPARSLIETNTHPAHLPTPQRILIWCVGALLAAHVLTKWWGDEVTPPPIPSPPPSSPPSSPPLPPPLPPPHPTFPTFSEWRRVPFFRALYFRESLFLMHKCLNRDHHSCDKPLKAKVFFILYPSRAV